MTMDLRSRPLSVFISYNRLDKDIAREIALFIISEDISVWLDEWEVNIGDSIIQTTNEGLQHCTHFIIIWSENASKSNWINRELNAALARTLHAGSPRILPILLDDTPLPNLLSDIRYLTYDDGKEKNRYGLIEAITGHPPSRNFIKAVVKKYKELIYDSEAHPDDPLPFKACPECGNPKLKRSSDQSPLDGGLWFIIECKECGWIQDSE